MCCGCVDAMGVAIGTAIGSKTGALLVAHDVGLSSTLSFPLTLFSPDFPFPRQNLYIAFANFEERQREFERARVIYKYALDHIPRAKAPALFAKVCSSTMGMLWKGREWERKRV